VALTTHTSGEYRFERGQLQRSKKVLAIRGLNRNHNHDLKNIFKGAATWAAANSGPFKNFYEACVARGTKPHLWHASPWRARLPRSLCWFGRKECVIGAWAWPAALEAVLAHL